MLMKHSFEIDDNLSNMRMFFYSGIENVVTMVVKKVKYYSKLTSVVTQTIMKLCGWNLVCEKDYAHHLVYFDMLSCSYPCL